ncbi:VOC family protein [Halobaculum limi]|uniref:VOC family protein n=1 Tax=Halobaculum limi TaxID=3031916 RepID=UPI002407355C|nr:VOC family protein [Halobaculum sp. YSMS11]
MTVPHPTGSTTYVDRVTLAVTDLDAVLAFYREVVGLAVLDRTSDRAVLGTDDRSLLVLEADPDADERPPRAAGLFHTAFLFPSRAALGDALHRIQASGDQLTGASDHRVSEALYLRDPEGNGVELYRDRPREEWPETDGRVEMDTLPLDTDALLADRAGAADASAPSETAVGHVHLEVTDLDDSEAFYVDGVGFDVRQRWADEALFVAADGYHHHVGLNTWNRRSDPVSGRGLVEISVVVPDEDAVDAARDRLAGIGARVDEDSDDSFLVSDPDGIRIRIRAD